MVPFAAKNTHEGARYPAFRTLSFILHYIREMLIDFLSQLLAVDASARVSMKDAAKCDKHCEWQNFENQ